MKCLIVLLIFFILGSITSERTLLKAFHQDMIVFLIFTDTFVRFGLIWGNAKLVCRFCDTCPRTTTFLNALSFFFFPTDFFFLYPCHSVDPAEVLTADPVDLHCIPVETHLCPIPKLLVAAPVSLNSVSLGRNLS